MNRSTWETPRLVILSRSRPEETVLAACKAATGGDSPSNSNVSCRYDPTTGGGPGLTACGPCQLWADS